MSSVETSATNPLTKRVYPLFYWLSRRGRSWNLSSNLVLSSFSPLSSNRLGLLSPLSLYLSLSLRWGFSIRFALKALPFSSLPFFLSSLSLVMRSSKLTSFSISWNTNIIRFKNSKYRYTKSQFLHYFPHHISPFIYQFNIRVTPNDVDKDSPCFFRDSKSFFDDSIFKLHQG